MSSSKLQTKLAAVDGALSELEDALRPLLAAPLPATAAGLESLQRAKLHALVPYLTNGLLFIFLKTQGVDPKTHPVVQELERVKVYFQKIKAAEEPEKRTTAVDKDAAARFITAAIRQATGPQVTVQPAGPSSSAEAPSVRVPAKVTNKMRARAEYEAQLVADDADAEEDDDGEIGVFDDDAAPSSTKSKGKYETSDAPTKRRKRTALDVIDSLETSARSTPSSLPGSTKDPKKKRKKPRAPATT